MRQWAIVLTLQLFEGIVNRKQLLYNSASALRSHQCSESPMCRKTILELEIRATRHCLVPMTILSGSHEATSRLFWASLTLPWLRLFSKDCVFYFFWHGASQELIPAPESLVKFKDFLYELRRVWIYFSDLQYIQSPSIQNYTIKMIKKIKIYHKIWLVLKLFQFKILNYSILF